MTACAAGPPHELDVGAGLLENLVGSSAAGACPSGFFEGFSFASYLLLFGALFSAFLWKRSPRWAALIAAVALAYWTLIKFTHLRFFDTSAVASQSLFEIVALALLPAAFVLLLLRLRRSGPKRTVSQKAWQK